MRELVLLLLMSVRVGVVYVGGGGGESRSGIGWGKEGEGRRGCGCDTMGGEREAGGKMVIVGVVMGREGVRGWKGEFVEEEGL